MSVRGGAVLVLALAAWAASAWGQDVIAPSEWSERTTPGVEVDVAIGLAGRCDFDYPVPMALTLDNQLDRDLEGMWEVVRLVGTRETEAVASVPVFCGRGARVQRRVALYLVPGAYVVRVVEGSTIVWRRWTDLDTQGAVALDRRSVHILVVHASDSRVHLSLARPVAKVAGLVPTPGAGFRQAAGDPVRPGARAIESWRVEPAALPTDAICYCPYHAVAFAPADVLPSLDAPTAEALSQFVWLGGQVFLPLSAVALREQLIAALPPQFRAEPPAPQGEPIDVARVGLGRIVTVNDVLFGQAEGRQAVARLVEDHEQARLPRWSEAPYYYGSNELTPNATASMMQIGGLFALYALVAGPGLAMFLRRRSRRTVAIVFGLIVVAFCALAALTGPYLGSSPGDYRWTSVTELGPRGAVQWARFRLTSAGARTHAIELGPEQTLAWELAARTDDDWNRWRFYGEGRGRRVARATPLRGEIAVEISPWGERELTAATPGPAWPPLGVRVRVDGERLRAVVTNSTPMFLRNARVIVGGWSYRGTKWSAGWLGARHSIPIGMLGPGERGEGDASTDDEGQDYVYAGVGEGFEYPPPETRDRVQGLFIADIEVSPTMSPITRTFDLDPTRTAHILVQRLEIAELPLPGELLRDETDIKVAGSGSSAAGSK